MMQQYLVFFDIPYDKVYHTFDSGESIFTQSGKNELQIQIDEDFQYNPPSLFMRMGGTMILSRLIN